MRQKFLLLSISILILVGGMFFLLREQKAYGQIIDGHPACGGSKPACWSTRTAERWACSACPSTALRCQGHISWGCARCSNFPDAACSSDADCDFGPYYPAGTCGASNAACAGQGPCIYVCVNSPYPTSQCENFSDNLACNNVSGSSCNWQGYLENCTSSVDSCDLDLTWTTLSCCGPGSSSPTPTPIPGCTATAPTNLTTPGITGSGATLQWTPGTGGTKQQVMLGTVLSEVSAGCPSGFGGTCLIIADNLSTTKNFFSTDLDDRGDGSGPAVLSPNTLYYWRVVNYLDAACSASAVSSFTTAIPVCSAPLNLTGTTACDASDSLLDITWRWNVVTGATQYLFQADNTSNLFPSPEVSNGLDASAVCSGATCTYITNNITPGTWYGRVKVLVSDGSCDYSNPPWSLVTSVTNTCTAAFTGTVYNDLALDAYLSGGVCVNPTPDSGTQPGASSRVRVNDSLGGLETGPVGGGGAYTVSGVPISLTGNQPLLENMDAGWVCKCPAGCAYGANFASPASGVNFFVTQRQGGWAQTVGGDVMVGADPLASGDISIPIPGTCSSFPTCTPQFSLAGTDSVGVVQATGTVSFDPSGAVSSTGWQAASGYSGPQFRHAFWRKEARTVVPIANLTTRPATGGPTFEVQSATDITLTGANWQNIPQPLTIFVTFTDPNPLNRTLTINPDQHEITMNPLVMLTIITNGNIQAADPLTRLEGVYLTDGQFRTCASATRGTPLADQFRFRGSVIAWGGVELARDLDLDNRMAPAELFTYEPEFLSRLPDFIQRSIFSWHEVAP